MGTEKFTKDNPDSFVFDTIEGAIEDIVACAQDGDIVMTVGAGDVTALGARLLESLQVRHGGESKKSEA